MLVSTALVLLMVPGLALFYGGIVGWSEGGFALSNIPWNNAYASATEKKGRMLFK